MGIAFAQKGRNLIQASDDQNKPFLEAQEP